MRNATFRTMVGLVAAMGFGGGVAWGSVEIVDVSFRQIEHDLREGTWLEAVVEVDAQRERGGGDYVRDVVVSLALAIETNFGGERGFEFFLAEAEPVALEDGRSAIRFYLPPEIVDMYDANGEPFSFLAQVELRGEVVSARLSEALESEMALASFRDRLAEQGERNAGVLRPQHLSPFFDYYPRSTPTFKVEGAAR